jgi:ADP-heptose:LPS heptosyltransferase
VNPGPEKILAVQFKYLGDAVFLTPALRALRENWPAAELHVLVAAEVVPLLRHLPWLTKVWALPRTRGKARLSESLPVVRALRREKFDRVVDFEGNDRGTILSYFSGAPRRLGVVKDPPSWLQKIGYTERFPAVKLPASWVKRHLELLKVWQVPAPTSLQLEIVADPSRQTEAAKLLPAGRILCHLATSQPKKEWPLAHWVEFNRQAMAMGWATAFSSGTNEREQAMMARLKALDAGLFTLPPVKDLSLFLAVLKQARAVVAGDTGPLHFAAGLGRPVIGLYATGDSIRRTAPVYPAEQVLTAPVCVCDQKLKNLVFCEEATPCIAAIRPEQVVAALKQLLKAG